MSAICQSAVPGVGKINTSPTVPLLKREWTARSWLNRLVGWVRSKSRPRRAPSEPTEPRGPGERPGEPESTSRLNDPTFWMLLTH